MHILIYGSDSIAVEMATVLSSSYENTVYFVSTSDFSHLELYHDLIVYRIEDHSISTMTTLNQQHRFDTCLFLDQDHFRNFVLTQIAATQWHCLKILYLTHSDLLAYHQIIQNSKYDAQLQLRAISTHQLVTDKLLQYFNHTPSKKILHLTYQDLYVSIHHHGELPQRGLLTTGDTDSTFSFPEHSFYDDSWHIDQHASSHSTTSLQYYSADTLSDTFFHDQSSQHQNIIMIGSGSVARSFISHLSPSNQLTLIEPDGQNAQILAATFPDIIVLESGVHNEEVLASEDIGSIDAFLALSDDDEQNLISALHAKRQGARYTAALVTNPQLIDIVDEQKIDLLLSTHQLTYEYILPFVQNTALLSIHDMPDGKEKWVEIQIPNHLHGSKISTFELSSWFIACKRNGAFVRLHPDFVMQENDICSIFLPHHDDLEKLKQWLGH